MIGRTRFRVQTGRGLGSILSSIFSKLAPVARTVYNAGKRAINSTLGQSILKTTGQSVAEGGVNLIDDVLKGENVKNSLVKRAKNTAEKSLTDSAKLIQDAVKRKFVDPTIQIRTKIPKRSKKKTGFWRQQNSPPGHPQQDPPKPVINDIFSG